MKLNEKYNKIALVLPGGGAKGGFHVGALKAITEENPDLQFDVISGVSVGALNGAMMATRDFKALWQAWETIKEEDILKKRSWLSLSWHLLSWKAGFNKPLKGIYSNEPLQETISKHIGTLPHSDLVIGNVNITKGQYEKQIYRKGEKLENTQEFYDHILASTAIPGIWPPTKIGQDQYIDGGVRNIAPLGDVIEYNPDLVIVIPTEPYPEHKNLDKITNGNIIDTLSSSVEHMTYEIFKNDLQKFLMVNKLVKQGQSKGITFKNDNGEPYEHYKAIVIPPKQDLGNPLDFSRRRIDQRILDGYNRAKFLIQTV